MLREIWKSVAVPSVMYGMEVIAWNESEIDKLEVGQNRIARMALKRGDMECSTFRERHIKATLRYKVRLERMENTIVARNVYFWNVRSSKWEKNIVDRSGMLVRWVHRFSEEREWVYQ